MNTWQASIPESLQEAVRTALSATFGAAPCAVMERVIGGASGAVALHLVARGHSYLLRVEVNPSVMRNPHQYSNMRLAAAAGIAPRLYHADEVTGIAVIDFIQQQPLHLFPGGPLGLATALGAMIRELQATSPFPALVDYRAFLGQLLSHLQGVFAPGLLEQHREGFERIQSACHWDEATHVSSHNDPNPRNVLFDGERLWLIDWETAYRNDPLLDLAILADNHAPTPELQDALLHSWRGTAPDRPTLARLHLMKLLSRLYYAGLLIASSGTPPGSIADLSALSPEEFRAKVAGGELAPTAPATRVVLGNMYLAGFLFGCEASDFNEMTRVAG